MLWAGITRVAFRLGGGYHAGVLESIHLTGGNQLIPAQCGECPPGPPSNVGAFKYWAGCSCPPTFYRYQRVGYQLPWGGRIYPVESTDATVRCRRCKHVLAVPEDIDRTAAVIYLRSATTSAPVAT